MDHFTAHCLRFECEVVTPLRLNEHTGSAIRGAFYHALWNQFCMNHEARVHNVPAGRHVPGGVFGEHAGSPLGTRGERAQAVRDPATVRR